MNSKKEYSIPFTGLKLGIHTFKYQVGAPFFEKLDYSEVKKSNVSVTVNFNKQNAILILDFEIKGTVNVMCDRCADYFDLSVENQQQLIAKLAAHESVQEDDIIYLSPTESELDIGHYIYEYIMLAIPQKRIHPEGMCNKETLKRLEKLTRTTKELNKITDPRWDELKKIKFN